VKLFIDIPLGQRVYLYPEVIPLALKLTEDQRRWLLEEYPEATRQHIFAWESGTFPGPKWMPILLKITGKSYEEIRAMYPDLKSASGATGN